MFRHLIAPAALAAMALSGQAHAASITLNGTIRDFSAAHPDMESTIGGLQRGQVASTLGADGKPVWTGPAKSGFTTEANFNQWYADVPGVNQSRAFSLDLQQDASNPTLYRYTDSAFFPIDGELGGNEGRSHNYHFTLQLGGTFSFQDDQSFTFLGDDDLWVYFGGQLGIDLGGVHAAQSATITSAGLEALGLSKNTEYALDIFFAERHTTQSNFNITTSFAVTETPPAVPLPAALPMLLAGIGALGFARARRKG